MNVIHSSQLRLKAYGAEIKMRANSRMIRIVRSFALVAVLALTGCGKIHMPSFGKKAATPAPAAVAAAAPTPAPAAAPATPAPGPTPAPKPAKLAIDPHAQVVVLCYHRIEGKVGGALSIEVDLFKSHMQQIK